MMKLGMLLAILVAGCGSDDCEKMFDKMMSMMPKDAKPKKAPDKGKFVAECHEKMKTASDEDKQVMKCMLGAADMEAMEMCATGGKKLKYLEKSKSTEAELQLNKLGKSAKAVFNETSLFPIGKATTLPAGPCCGEPGGKCPATTAWSTDKVWTALDFQIDEPARFQYSYESADGKTATVTAVGDLDCDATTITYTLKLESTGGNPTATLVKPANSD